MPPVNQVVDSWFREQFISLWIIPTEQSNGPAEYSLDDVTIDPFLFSFEENDREFTYSGFCGDGATREELLVLGTDQRTRQKEHDDIVRRPLI